MTPASRGGAEIRDRSRDPPEKTLAPPREDLGVTEKTPVSRGGAGLQEGRSLAEVWIRKRPCLLPLDSAQPSRPDHYCPFAHSPVHSPGHLYSSSRSRGDTGRRARGRWGSWDQGGSTSSTFRRLCASKRMPLPLLRNYIKADALVHIKEGKESIRQLRAMKLSIDKAIAQPWHCCSRRPTMYGLSHRPTLQYYSSLAPGGGRGHINTSATSSSWLLSDGGAGKHRHGRVVACL